MHLLSCAVRRAACSQRAPALFQRRFLSVANLVEQDDALSQITAHDKFGFKVNGVHLRGSVIVFRNFSLLWNVQKAVDISPRNAAVVHMLEPRVGACPFSQPLSSPNQSALRHTASSNADLFIVGTGEKLLEINPSLYGYFSRKGVSVEPMSTVRLAASGESANRMPTHMILEFTITCIYAPCRVCSPPLDARDRVVQRAVP